jgi:hypothetical protein
MVTYENLRLAVDNLDLPIPEAIVRRLHQELSRLSSNRLSQEIEDCLHAWSQTLAFFRASRPILPSEKMEMGRAIQTHGKDGVLLILLGCREEKGSDGFDPTQHVSLTRIFSQKNASRFATLGAQRQEREKQKVANQAVVQATVEPIYQAPQEEWTPMTAEAKALLASLGLRKPREEE